VGLVASSNGGAWTTAQVTSSACANIKTGISIACAFAILRSRSVWPIEVRKETLANLLRGSEVGLQLNEHFHEAGDVIFRHACKLGCEGIVSKRLGSPCRSGRSRDWLKMKNPEAPAVKREAEEDWGKGRVALKTRTHFAFRR
jgi:hypothetical protein